MPTKTARRPRSKVLTDIENLPFEEDLADYSNAAFWINTEGDQPNHIPSELPLGKVRQAHKIWRSLMKSYRNWERARRGLKFTVCKQLCVLPGVVIDMEGHVLAVPQIEFSGRENTFTGGLRKQQNVKTGRITLVQEHQGLTRAKLRKRLPEFLHGCPKSIRLSAHRQWRSYYTIVLITSPQHLPELRAYIRLLDKRLDGEFKDLQTSHEHIC